MIVSPSGLHTYQIRYAIEAGLHVFSEKPLGIKIDDIEETIDVIQSHPNQVFQLGFMRRYDSSYQYAKKIIESSELGEITLIRCYGIDPSSGMESFIRFTNQEAEKVWALEKNMAYPELDILGEMETGTTLIQMQNGIMAILVAGRNAAHGYHVETEIMGTEGMIRIGTVPEKNLVTILNKNGIVRPTSQSFPERFKDAFINEMIEFEKCIREGKQPQVTVYDGLQSTKIALACQCSYAEKKLVSI